MISPSAACLLGYFIHLLQSSITPLTSWIGVRGFIIIHKPPKKSLQSTLFLPKTSTASSVTFPLLPVPSQSRVARLARLARRISSGTWLCGRVGDAGVRHAFLQRQGNILDLLKTILKRRNWRPFSSVFTVYHLPWPVTSLGLRTPLAGTLPRASTTKVLPPRAVQAKPMATPLGTLSWKSLAMRPESSEQQVVATPSFEGEEFGQNQLVSWV